MPPGRDVIASSANALLFSFGLGMSSVALPLLALAGGHGAGAIGLLVTLSAVVQIVTRLGMGAVLRHVPDRTLLVVAVVALSTSFLIATASAALPTLMTAWACQGLARALFWTCGQTHSVRAGGSSVGALAVLNIFGSVGQLLGPVVAGALADVGLLAPLVVGGIVSATALLPACVLDRLPPFRRVESAASGRMWRRRGVRAACWCGVGAGAWRSLLDSYVPVILDGLGKSATTIGILVSVANGASILGAVIARIGLARLPSAYVISTFGTALGMAGFCIAAGHIPPAAIALAVSGLGAGVLQTLGPALAAASVHREERGAAIAVSGTFRTIAMFAVPLSVSTAVMAVPAVTAILALSVALCGSSLAVRSLRPRGGDRVDGH